MKNIIMAVFVLGLVTACASSNIGINANVPESLGLSADMDTETAMKKLKATERILMLSEKLTNTVKVRVNNSKQLASIAARLGDSHGKQVANLFKIRGFEAESETLMASMLEKKLRFASLSVDAQVAASQELANDAIKLENLGMQIELLKEQDTIMTAIRDKGIQAFDSAGQKGIKDMITNKEGSAGDMMLGVAQSTLGGMAGAASEKMMAPITGRFKKLMGIEDEEDKRKRVFNKHVDDMKEVLQEHIKGIKGTGGEAGTGSDIDSVFDSFNTERGPGDFEAAKGFKDFFSQMFGGGGMGSIFSLLSGMFGFGAKGGMVRRYANGTGPAGATFVPGTGTGDTVPAMLTPGEIVIPKGKRVGGNYNTTINVNMEGGVDVTTDDQAGEALGMAIQSAVSEEIANQQRPGGLLSPFGGGG